MSIKWIHNTVKLWLGEWKDTVTLIKLDLINFCKFPSVSKFSLTHVNNDKLTRWRANELVLLCICVFILLKNYALWKFFFKVSLIWTINALWFFLEYVKLQTKLTHFEKKNLQSALWMYINIFIIETLNAQWKDIFISQILELNI